MFLCLIFWLCVYSLRICFCCLLEIMLGYIKVENFGDSILICGFMIFDCLNVIFYLKVKFIIDVFELWNRYIGLYLMIMVKDMID